MTRVRAYLKGTENHLLADLLGKWHDHSMLHLHKKKWKCYEGLGLESERSKFKSCLLMNCEIWGLWFLQNGRSPGKAHWRSSIYGSMLIVNTFSAGFTGRGKRDGTDGVISRW